MTRSAKKKLLSKIQSPFFKGMVPVYHSISNGQSSPLFTSSIHDITVEEFEKQLTRLKRNHSFVFIDELSEQVRRGKNIQRIASITFDDGYRNFLTNALPVLEYLDVPVTMFLTTKILKGGVLWRDKIRLIMEEGLVFSFLEYLKESLKVLHDLTPLEFYQKSKDPSIFKSSEVEFWVDDYLTHMGIDPTLKFKETYLRKDDIVRHPLINFGNHTENHFMMSSLNKDRQLEEIQNAQISLRTLDVSLSECFAVPFGNPISYNDYTLEAANELGYETVLLAQADRARGFVNRTGKLVNNQTLMGMRFLPNETALY